MENRRRPAVRTTIGAAENVVDLLGRKPLRRLMARRDRPGLLFLGGHLALLGATGFLLARSLGTIWVVPALLLHGIVVVHFFAPFHETSHRTAFRSRWLNETVYWLCGLVLGLMPMAFRFQHADHHTYTQDIRRDPQMIPTADRVGGYLLYASAIPYFSGIARALLFHPVGRFNEAERRSIPVNMTTTVRLEACIFWAVYLALAVVSVWLETWAVLIFWLIPRIVAEPVERVIRMSEHVGCSRTDDILRNSRTVLACRPVRWLSWNMPFHTAHHAVPLVPFHAIPDLNAMLISHVKEVRKGYPAAIGFQISNAWNNRSAATPA